jgi:hypothetical protein
VSELSDLARALGTACGWTEEESSTLTGGEDLTRADDGAWWVDGEDLAEGEVEQWLARLAPALLGCGAAVDGATAESPHQEESRGYEVTLGGERVRLFGWADGEPGVPDTDDPWRDCTVLPAAALNRRLAAAGSSRRLGLLAPGANDGLAVLADPAALASLAPRWRFEVP